MDINLGLSAVATGTADVITATYTPAPTLVDKKILFLRITTPNTTTTPTFSPNGLTAHTIVSNGSAIKVGDLNGVVCLMYDLANTRWELLNPKYLLGILTQDQIDAIVNANAPTSANPFATTSDIPAQLTLAQLISAGNTGGNDLLSPNSLVYLRITDTTSEIYFTDGVSIFQLLGDATNGGYSWTNGTKSGGIISSAIKTDITHTDLINLQATSVTKNGIEIATINDLVDTFIIDFSFAANFNPADSTSYYWSYGFLAPSITDTANDFNLGYAFSIIGVNIQVVSTSVAGTSEASAIKIRNVTQATSSTVGNITTNGTSTSILPFAFTGLNIAVASTDFICMQIDTPAWVTNPTGTRFSASLICQRT